MKDADEAIVITDAMVVAAMRAAKVPGYIETMSPAHFVAEKAKYRYILQAALDARYAK